MIYDCFIFNSELDLLELRLEYLYNKVDFFALVEAGRTLSGLSKPLYFKENQKRFERFKDKIIALESPEMPDLKDWEYEYFQRNYIKEGLQACKSDDVIFISDVDEIINIDAVLNYKELKLPALIELPVYYYFFNLRSNVSFKVNLITKYDFIKDMFIGERNNSYPKLVKNIVCANQVKTGWHFSYLFGFDVVKYIEKISSFSHQEYNNSYYKRQNRIRKCITLGIDLFDRYEIKYHFENDSDFKELNDAIKEVGLTHLIYRPTLSDYIKLSNVEYYVRKQYFPSLKAAMKKRANKAFTDLKSTIKIYAFKIYAKFVKSYNHFQLEKQLDQLSFRGNGIRVEMPYSFLNPRHISIGNNFTAKNNLRLEAILLYEGTKCNPNIEIGNNVVFDSDVHVRCLCNIRIGDNVSLASRVFISDTLQGKIPEEENPNITSESILSLIHPIVISDNVRIGEGVCVLPGVTIGRGAIIGANSLVDKDVPENCVVAGMPAKTIRFLK